MPNTPRSSNSGRFVKASSAAAKRAQAGPSIKSYFTPVGTTQSSSIPSRHVILDEDISTISSPVTITDSIGRPPAKLSLQPGNVVHETTNGVTTVLTASETPSTTSSGLSLLIGEHGKPPVTSSKTGEKRVLRSKDGSSRVTSELARFFADYEDIVFGLPKEPEFLTSDTILFIADKKGKDQVPLNTASTRSPQAAQIEIPDSQEECNEDASFTQQSLAHDGKVDFGVYEQEAAAFKEDPLGDYMYVKPHRRAERKEKQLRNIEKEHALHEKAELEKLLDDLRGSEWLRAMGLTGVADVDRKKYMTHRDYFISRVVALLDKFTAWKDQEKEMRARREEAQAVREEAEDDDLDITITSRGGSLPSFVVEADPSARQLQVEARLAATPVRKITLKLSKPAIVLPLEPQKPFTSFYSKPQLREAALGKSRRGRNMTAFGLPLPDSKEKDFALPDNFVSEEALIANARKRRRLKRESHGTGLTE